MNTQSIHHHKVDTYETVAFETVEGSCVDCGKTVQSFWIDPESDRHGRWSKWS